jgi:anaerobic selenocysteine-containing dehydrogenase
MNTKVASWSHADRQGRATGDYKIPSSSIRTPTPPRWCPMPISSCPIRPISSAGTASRCSTVRSASRRPRRCHPPARSCSPTATCASFQTVLIDLGARLGLPGSPTRTDRRNIRAATPTTSSITSARPASARWPAGAVRTAPPSARARSIRTSFERYIDNGGFWHHELADDQRYYKIANRSYLEFARHMGFIGKADRSSSSSIRAAAEVPAGGARARAPCSRPNAMRARFAGDLRSAADLVSAVRGGDGRHAETYPLHALTQRPMHMYHSWGSQNAWLRQITGQNKLYVSTIKAAEMGLVDDDWVWIVTSHNGGSRADQAHGGASTPIRSGPGTPSASARARGR